MSEWFDRKRRMSRRGYSSIMDRGYEIFPVERVYIQSEKELKKMSMKEFAENEKKKLDKEAETWKAEQNLPGFFVPLKGENQVEVLDVEVREKDFGNGLRKIFRVKVGSEEKDWSVNPANPIYKQVIRRLAEGISRICLLRTGEGKATRYELLDKEGV